MFINNGNINYVFSLLLKMVANLICIAPYKNKGINSIIYIDSIQLENKDLSTVKQNTIFPYTSFLNVLSIFLLHSSTVEIAALVFFKRYCGVNLNTWLNFMEKSQLHSNPFQMPVKRTCQDSQLHSLITLTLSSVIEDDFQVFHFFSLGQMIEQ